jgi:hypothetical protein
MNIVIYTRYINIWFRISLYAILSNIYNNVVLIHTIYLISIQSPNKRITPIDDWNPAILYIFET